MHTIAVLLMLSGQRRLRPLPESLFNKSVPRIIDEVQRLGGRVLIPRFRSVFDISLAVVSWVNPDKLLSQMDRLSIYINYIPVFDGRLFDNHHVRIARDAVAHYTCRQFNNIKCLQQVCRF